MATNIGSLLWVSGIDNTGLRKDANQASQIVGGIGTTANGVKSQLMGMASALGIVAGGAGLVSLGKQVIEIRGQFQQLGIAFETMLGSKEKADKLMGELVQFAAKTPFTLTDVATNTKQLLAMGIETEKVMATMKSLGDVAAGVSVPLQRIAVNYGQVATQGALSGRDFKDFMLQGIPIMDEFVKMTGKSAREIKDMVEAGQVGFPMVEQAFKNMAGEGGKFYNLMEKQNASVTGQISNLTDKWEVMLNEIGKGNEGLIYGGISGLAGLISNYETILDILKVLVVTYGAYKAAIILTNVTQTVQTTLGVYDIATKELQIGATIRATAAQSALNKAIMANPYVFALAAIVAIGSALYIFSDEAKTTEDVIKDLNDAVAAIGKQLEIDAAIKKYEELKDKVGKTKEEQNELNELIKKLSAIFPDAIAKYDSYGNAISLNTEKLIANNKELREGLRLAAGITKTETESKLAKAQAKQKELVARQTGTEVAYYKKDEKTGKQIPIYTELTPEQLSKNKDELLKVAKEVDDLQNKLLETDGELIKLGSNLADSFIKKHKGLFKATNEYTKAQAITARQQLLELFGAANKNEQDAIIKKANELDAYAKGIKTTREETQKWTEDLAAAQIKLAELKDPNYESKAGIPGQEIADQETIVKDLRDKLGLTKKGNDDAKKLADERLDYETEIGRKRIDAQLKIEQDLLNLKKDSDEKLRMQADLDYRKTLNEIAKNKAEEEKKYKELYGKNLPQADQDIFTEQATVAEKTKTDAIEKINKDAADKIKAIWKTVNDARLSDIEREKAAVDEKYKVEIKAAEDAKDTVLANTLKKSATTEKDSITRKYKLDELDFAQEIEMRKNEIALGGFNSENKLAKLNFETFKKYQEQKIAILKASGTPEDLKQAELLQTALDLSGLDENKRKSEEIANNFFDAANYASDLAAALGDSNSALAELLTGISKVANTMGDLVSKGAFDGTMSKKDAIGSAISGATQLIGMVVGQAAKNKKEMKDYYDSIISQQKQYNLALNEQLRLNQEINGSIFFDDFAKTLSDSSKALKDANEQRDKAMDKFWQSEAIVGKKNAISGGNVLSGIGAGAALGAGIGTLLGGPIIGTAVGALIGGLVGLFSKKKKDITKPLLDVYPDLIQANGKFNVELAKTLVGTKAVTKETSKILQEIIDWEEAAKKARDQITAIISDMAGNIGNDLRDALVDAFENGTNSAAKFGESVTKILEDIVSKQIFNALFGPLLKKLEDDMKLSYGIDPVTGDSVGGAEVDNNWIDDILRFYAEVPKLTEQFNDTMAAVKVPGFDLFNGSTTGQSMTSTGQITRALTEDTGSALMGLWRRALDEQITTTKTILKSNDFLSAISVNTLRTADNTDKLESAVIELKAISENTRASYLNDMGL